MRAPKISRRANFVIKRDDSHDYEWMRATNIQAIFFCDILHVTLIHETKLQINIIFLLVLYFSVKFLIFALRITS